MRYAIFVCIRCSAEDSVPLAGQIERSLKLDLHPDDLEIISAKLKSGFNRLHALAEGRGYYPKIKPRLMSQHVDLVRENEIESYKYNVDQRRRHKVV